MQRRLGPNKVGQDKKLLYYINKERLYHTDNLDKEAISE